MASVFSKRSILYIGWYDWSTNKTRNRSTRLPDTKENRKLAKVMAVTLQNELDAKKIEIESSGIMKGNTIKSAFEHFKRINSNKDPKTIKDYDYFYSLFKQSFDENNSCLTINKLSAEDWILKIRSMKKAKNTIFSYFKQFRHFYNFLFEYNYTPMFKVNRDVAPKAEVKNIIVFTDEDIQKIFNGLKEKNLNFQCMIHLAYYTGLRSSDLLSITVENMNLKEKRFAYYEKKIKTWRSIPFHDALEDILRKAIMERTSGRLLDYNNVENMNKAFLRYLKALGLNGKGYSMRIFRKTFITNASLSMDLATVANLVGHKQITTTAKYYTKVDHKRQKDQLDKIQKIESAE